MSYLSSFGSSAATGSAQWRSHSDIDSCSVYGYMDGTIFFRDTHGKLHVIRPCRLIRLLRQALHWPSELELLRRREQYLLEKLRKRQEQQEQGSPASPLAEDDDDDDSVICLD